MICKNKTWGSAMGLSAVCDCGISGSYSLSIGGRGGGGALKCELSVPFEFSVEHPYGVFL